MWDERDWDEDGGRPKETVKQEVRDEVSIEGVRGRRWNTGSVPFRHSPDLD